jgi:hypothetical protein
VSVGHNVAYWPHMTAKETTLDTILSTVERGFAAVAGDIGEMKSEIREMKSARRRRMCAPSSTKNSGRSVLN